MAREVRSALIALFALFAFFASVARAAEGDGQPQLTAEQQAYMDKVASLKWVKGPTTVDAVGNAKLVIPEGYVYLDQRETDKFLELNQNMFNGREVMIAPDSLEWSAYLNFADEGYVKDDEAIDAPDLLKAIQAGMEEENKERRRRGWAALHVTGWALQPAYNSATKRLEWATLLRSDGSDRESANYLTKILGRRGHTTVILAAAPEDLSTAERALNRIIEGYTFNPGDTYAEWVPGDKVAEYGLAALVLGGAAAVATKKGLWGVLAGALAASWKFIAAGAVALGAGLKRFLGKKDA
jgi:uncharacterized membrane-anchored protein